VIVSKNPGTVGNIGRWAGSELKHLKRERPKFGGEQDAFPVLLPLKKQSAGKK
jgi:hypothetical protein